jgi:hypothetical protein
MRDAAGSFVALDVQSSGRSAIPTGARSALFTQSMSRTSDSMSSCPVGGELTVALQRRLTELVTAVIQPGSHPYCRQRSVRDKYAGGVQSVDISRSTDLPPNRSRTRVMPRSASDTAHDSGTASDTD